MSRTCDVFDSFIFRGQFMRIDLNSKNENETIWTKKFVLVVIINMLTFLGFNMATVGIPIFASEIDANDVQIGLLTTCAAFAALVMRPVAGIIVTKFFRKYTLLIGLLIMSIASFIYWRYPVIGMILIGRVIHGIGWGLSSTASSTLAVDVIPPKKIGEGLGYVSSVTSLATALAPAIGVGLISNYNSSSMIMVMLSSSILGVFLLLLFRTDSNKVNERKYEQTGYNLFNKNAIFPAFIIAFVTLGYSSIATFIAQYAMTINVLDISLFFTVYAIATMFTRPIFGKIVDKIGWYKPALISLICMIIGLFIISISTNLYSLIFAAFLAGVSMGMAMVSLQSLAVKNISFEDRGSAISTFLFGFDFGMAFGSALAGFAVNLMGYKNMYILMAIIPLVAILALLKKRSI